jgi:hypothetical protein
MIGETVRWFQTLRWKKHRRQNSRTGWNEDIKYDKENIIGFEVLTAAIRKSTIA